MEYIKTSNMEETASNSKYNKKGVIFVVFDYKIAVLMGSTQSDGSNILDRLGDCFQQINLCLRPQLQSSQLAGFAQAHYYLSVYQDPYYGECHVLQSKPDQSLCVLQKETLDRKDHQSRIDRLGEIMMCGQGPANRNIIRCAILADLEKVGFLWRKHELYVAYDYILFDLEKEFEHRKAANLEFSQAEIRTIIRECTKGFLRLELTKYTSVRMKHIYFCDDGSEIRLAHPRLFNYRSNIRQICEDQKTDNIYLSPQEVAALEIVDSSFECGWASNAFSFGMTVLSLMTMRRLNDIYNYKSCEINFKRITQLVTVCNNRYSYHLVSLLQELLKQQQSQRLTFRALYNRIESSQNVTNAVELTLVQEETQNYEQVRVEKKEETVPKYPNFIAALTKPKVNLNGQYMSVTNEEDPKADSQIVASQRFRYSTAGQESIGNYLGKAVIRDTEEEVRHGKGLYQHKDGQVYIGEWKDGKMHGSGKLYFKNKKLRYEGDFKNGLFHGSGIEYSESQLLERELDIDQQYVKVFHGNWIKYEGYYVNDRREGVGKIYFRNGFWRGNFKNGQANGEGIYTCYTTNRVVKGEWRDGQLVSKK